MSLTLRQANLYAQYIPTIADDPLHFVETAFNWDSDFLKGKGILDWQREILTHIRDNITNVNKVNRIAVSSGHGIGKSALMSWIILWSMFRKDTRGIITANTETQLVTKTWAELSKWYNLSPICQGLLKMTKTALFGGEIGNNTWRFDATPNSQQRPEGFAGLHNAGKRCVVLVDEGSAIPDIIYDNIEGVFTDNDTQRLFCVFGNPTQATGRFRDFFKWDDSFIKKYTIDSRTVEITNKDNIKDLVEQWGEDSDFIRIRVRGLFPNKAFQNLISELSVDEAINNHIDYEVYKDSPRVIGVDVSRYGDDESVIVKRQGRKVWELTRLSGLSLMQLAGHIIKAINDFNPKIVFVDETGLGAGVVDRLLEQGYRQVRGINFSSNPISSVYGNKRSEMWSNMSKWLTQGADLPNDKQLKQDLIAPMYFFSDTNSKLYLEGKKQMDRRGIKSPDSADALALTFAEEVNNNNNNMNIGFYERI